MIRSFVLERICGRRRRRKSERRSGRRSGRRVEESRRR
jgi:hypothetical protein